MTIRTVQNTITRLKALRRLDIPAMAEDHLETFGEFGSNPGALSARCYIPPSLRKGAPLVVVLHGCTQTASGYDRCAAWSIAAEEHGFALLFPEQQRSNNANLCFNWFSPEDAARGRGECLSIRQMVSAMEVRHRTDPSRVFVTGLSAGGAMAGVMLATYPDVFAGGAIIAGLPFGTAGSVPEAFDRMRGHGLLRPEALADLVRSASAHQRPWPILSVWHGTSDTTVAPSNAQAIVDQWRVLQGLPEIPSRIDRINGCTHRVWADADQHAIIEQYLIPGMAHGTPLSTLGNNGEVAGPFMLEEGISSTRQTLKFWRIIDQAMCDQESARSIEAQVGKRPRDRIGSDPAQQEPPGSSGIQRTIEDALRTAGLLR